MAKINRNPNIWYEPKGTSKTEKNARSAGEVTDYKKVTEALAKIEAKKTRDLRKAEVQWPTPEERIMANIKARKGL